MKHALWGTGALFVGALALIAALFVAFIGGGGAVEAIEGPGGELDPKELPAGAEEWVREAGELCPEVSAPLLAATGWVESRWQLDAVSPVGARGPMQIMPATWEAYGVDADGDGTADPHSLADSIITAGRVQCANAELLTGWGMEPSIDHLAASYNAGAGAVRDANGVPPIVETENYVVQIRQAMGRYISGPLPGDEVPNPGAEAVIAAAQEQHGMPYAWSGGDYFGPTEGSPRVDAPGPGWDGTGIIGFDCSGLMEHAFYKGTNGEVRLGPHTRAQINDGTSVAVGELRPGDFVIFDDRAGVPFHVALYVGDGSFVHAEQPGTVVKTENLFDHPYWSSMTWHPRRVL